MSEGGPRRLRAMGKGGPSTGFGSAQVPAVGAGSALRPDGGGGGGGGVRSPRSGADAGVGAGEGPAGTLRPGPVASAAPGGLRSLQLRRQGAQDFGFTLRHFIAYPPESYLILGWDRRLQNAAEPMDTIFVRAVKENSPAHIAGLATGDRLVSVNGDTIGGKSYAQVVQLIQNSGTYLHLLVVPKEQDLLQRIYGETAHNPETNQRPQRMRSPEVVSERQESPYRPSPRPYSSSSDYQNVWTASPQAALAPGPGPAPEAAQYGTTGASLSSRRASEGSAQRREMTATARTQFITGAPVSNPPLPVQSAASRPVGTGTGTGVWESLPPHCRLSLDAGMLEGCRESSSSLPTATSSKDSLLSMDSSSTLQDGCSSDDSIILSRIRKSTEQKEEFLRRPAQPIWPVGDADTSACQQVQDGAIAREFYARPQKFQKQVWPPKNEKDGATQDLESGPGRGDRDRDRDREVVSPNFVCGGPVAVASANPTRSNKSFFSTLSRIQENQASVSSTGSEDTMMNGDSASLPSSCSSRGPDENQPHLPVIHLVSRRAKQFESGEEEDGTDRTSFYRSELARLSAKKGVPEVAVRKREFESRSLLDSCTLRRKEKVSSGLPSSSPLSGNQAIPIGSSKLHCDPPADFKDTTTTDDRQYSADSESRSQASRTRVRSHSADPTRHDQRHKAVRQDSYLAAVNTDRKRQAVNSALLEEEQEGFEVSPSSAPKIPASEIPISVPIRPTHLSISNPIRPASHPQRNSIGDPIGLVASFQASTANTDVPTVVRRQKDLSQVDEDRSTRRVSYRKATWNDRMHVDSDLDLSDSEPAPNVAHRRINRKWRPPLFPDDIQRLKRLFEEAASATGYTVSFSQAQGSTPSDPSPPTPASSAPPTANKENEQLLREGWLNCKVTLIDGKRATDRSWKQVWTVVRGSLLYLYKDRSGSAHSQQHETPLGSSEGEHTGSSVDLRCSLVEVATDYTKKKHVLRLNSASGSELLLQAETGADLLQWVRVLQDQAGEVPEHGQGLSPTVAHKSNRKLVSLRNRSPTGQSPLDKGRKPSQSESLPSPKSKTWKGRVAKQFRKMHQGGSNSPSSPTAPHPEGVTIGIPLEMCPHSTFSECVPRLLELCTNIVETRGLEVIGIYRVPGNTAAVTSLTESINKGLETVNLQDPRWADVNVISSLLKSFFRRLPDSLFTTELYPMFIEADKTEDPVKRGLAIRKLIRELPEHHFETLKYLLHHLKHIVEHSHTNKMEARNLAIVFGPTLVRAGDDNMVTMVTDMSSQCRIVETLITNVDWFFSEDDSEEFPLSLTEETESSLNVSSTDAVTTSSTASQNQSLLLGNIHKVEGMKESPSKDVSAKDIMASIITAANRKIQRGKSRKDSESAADSKQGAEPQRPKIKERTTSGSVTDTDSPPSASSQHKRRSMVNMDLNSTEAVSSSSVTDNRNISVTSQSFTSTVTTASTSSSPRPTFPSIRYSSPSGDDVTIMSYANLAQTTQERIRRFEQETKAMLERDRQTRESQQSQQWEEQRRRIEKQWLEAKQDLESEEAQESGTDPLSFKKLPVGGDKMRVDSMRSLLSSTSSSTSGSGTQLQQSWQAGWGSRLSSMSNTSSNSASSLQTSAAVQQESHSNGHLKRMKTGKEPRSGSLDSLQGGPASERPRSHLSDEGGDFLSTLITTFDERKKCLLGSSKENSVPTTSTVDSTCTSRTLTMTTSSNTSNDSCKTSSATEKEQPEKTPKESVRLLDCGDDIPYADTDTTEVCQNASVQENNPPKTTTPYRDPSLHRSSRLSRAFTAPPSSSDPDSKDFCKNSNTNASGEEGQKTLVASEQKNKTSSVTLNSQCDKVKRSESLNKSDRFQSSTKLKRSESLNKSSERTDILSNSKLRRSESLNKNDRSEFSANVRLRRSESLNKSDKDEKLKRSDSLTKTEKTESNMNRRRQQENRANVRSTGGSVVNNRDKETTKMLIHNATIVFTKLKRKNGMPERSIKRRHTVGGTKDFDKMHWLDNRLQSDQWESINSPTSVKEKKTLRTSSPDLGILVEISPLHTDAHRPHSLPDSNLVSSVYKVPLESHV